MDMLTRGLSLGFPKIEFFSLTYNSTSSTSLLLLTAVLYCFYNLIVKRSDGLLLTCFSCLRLSEFDDEWLIDYILNDATPPNVDCLLNIDFLRDLFDDSLFNYGIVVVLYFILTLVRSV